MLNANELEHAVEGSQKDLQEVSAVQKETAENIARLEVRLVRLNQISQLKKQFNKNLSSYIYQ